MTDLPKTGAMIRCVGGWVDAGAVTYTGHRRIDLPRRTEVGKIVPGAVDAYRLVQVANEWIYQLVIP